MKDLRHSNRRLKIRHRRNRAFLVQSGQEISASKGSKSTETERIFSTVVNALLKETNPVESGKLVKNGRKLNVIDLFCGCGGFSLGLKRAGLRIIAGIDFDVEAVATYRKNLPDVPHALQRDLTNFSPQELQCIIGNECVDVIVGGPPCQGFSTARQRDGANHGQRRLVHDARRHLYREFLMFVRYFQPKIFVMENVPGIRSAAGGEYFTKVQQESRKLGYRVHAQMEDAWELGVPQKRRRQLIIGVHNHLPGYFLPILLPSTRARSRPSLGVAIRDLPVLRAGGGEDEREYNQKLRERHLQRYGESARDYLFGVLEIEKAHQLTNHVARKHNDRDLRDFNRLHEGETSAVAMRERGVRFEFPYDKSCFKDRYTRQSRRKPCSTIVAHLSKDGLMFIHPTQTRSLTPREVARVQSFPDWFRFPASRTLAYRLIGNAVPPLVGEAIGNAVRAFIIQNEALSKQSDTDIDVMGIGKGSPSCLTASKRGMCRCAYLPKDPPAAAELLDRFAGYDYRNLRLLSRSDFIRIWHALLYLFPELHPDNALDHGITVERIPSNRRGLGKFEKHTARRYARSGWPLALEPFGREAWRRYRSGEFSDEVFYCQVTQRAGWEMKRIEKDDPLKNASII